MIREFLYQLVLLLCLLLSCFADATYAQKQNALARADRIELRARALYDAGRYDDGIRLEIKVLLVRIKILGPIDPAVAVALDNLAALYQDKGDYTRAEQLLDTAWRIVEQKLSPEHPYATRIRNSQASMYDDRGDYGLAKELYQSVVALREKVAAERPIDGALVKNCERSANEPDECQNHLDLAISLNDLAAVYEHEGDYDRAEIFFRRALKIVELLLPPDHQFVLKLLNNLAVVYDRKEETVEAERLFQRVLEVRLKTLGHSHPKVALSLNNLAAFYVRRGDLKRAEESLTRAIDIARHTLPADHVDIALILNNLSALAMAQGDYTQSVSWLTEGSTIQERHLSLILAIGSERQKQQYLGTLIDDTNQAVSLNAIFAPHDEAATNLALTTILRRKGRTLDAMADKLNAIRRSGAPQDRQLLYRLQAVGTRLANRHLSGPSQTESLSAWQTAFGRDVAEFERLEAQISRRNVAFRLKEPLVTVETVREQIPANAALIEFFEYLPFDPEGKTEGARWGAPHYIAYVVRGDKSLPQAVRLGDAAEIDEKVKRLRAALRNSGRQDVNELARSVYETVMEPIRPLLSNTTHLLLSPDGAINLIPFSALVDQRGRYLVEDYSLSYLTSGRDLLRLQEQYVNPMRSCRPIVIADPLYDMNAVQLPLSNRGQELLPGLLDENRRSVDLPTNFIPLSGTRDEAAALVNLLPNARLLTQRQATESALKQVRGPRLLHIATHGFFLADRSESALRTRVNENPLLRAGLVFSGANYLRGGGREDGILTALEAAGLNLSGTKLVVLSACETGLGDVQNGNGVYGFRRALVLAGAESQLMSLWKVNDETTQAFMIRYYNLLVAGQGRSEALRKVQLEILGRKGDGLQRTHPYFWAAFIQSGQWKTLVGQGTP